MHVEVEHVVHYRSGSSFFFFAPSASASAEPSRRLIKEAVRRVFFMPGGEMLAKVVPAAPATVVWVSALPAPPREMGAAF